MRAALLFAVLSLGSRLKVAISRLTMSRLSALLVMLLRTPSARLALLLKTDQTRVNMKLAF